MKTSTIQALLAIATATGSSVAVADVQNGSFESGLAGWSTAGDAAAVAGFAPVPAEHGNAQLVLTTASATFADDAPAPSAAFNVSGIDAAAAGGDLESAAGVAPGAFDPDAANAVQAFEGSIARQSFAAAAGAVLSFRWNFLSNDGLPGDFAFVVIDGALFKLADLGQAALPAGAWGLQSGYAGFTHQFGAGGMHDLVFGVVDVNDFSATSALLVDAVQVSAVPEPATGVLLALGLGALAVRAKRPSARA
jgi:hypothetical protein